MWAVRLPLDQLNALGAIRTTAGVEAADHDGAVWLRGRVLTEELHVALSKLPLAERFDILDGGILRPSGRLVPQGRLPDVAWRPIARFLEPELPTAALAGRIERRCPVTLIRATAERTANVLAVPLSHLVEYAATAPNLRLHPCRFAVNAAALAIVHGLQLPPLAGQRFVEEHGVALPAGWATSPRVPSKIVAEALQLAAGDLALFATDGRCERIAADQFVRLTRSAARMSMERPRHA